MGNGVALSRRWSPAASMCVDCGSSLSRSPATSGMNMKSRPPRTLRRASACDGCHVARPPIWRFPEMTSGLSTTVYFSTFPAVMAIGLVLSQMTSQASLSSVHPHSRRLGIEVSTTTTTGRRDIAVLRPRSLAVQQAREALGARLREIRIEAGLTARALAQRAGWHYSKISKIEHARQPPSVNDIHTWCRHCDASGHIPDLVASLHAVEGMWVEWQRLERTGMRRQQESYMALYQRTRQFRIYAPGVVPGLFQTTGYAAARMARIIEFSGIPNDLEEAVAARMDRQRVLCSGDHTFAVVLEAAALRARIGSIEMMVGQLGHLINIAASPRVSLGVIPSDVERTMWWNPEFWIFDEARVLVETPTAELTITQPREIAIYARTFAELASMAVYGAAARAIIMTAIEASDR
jgi:transcriptional regulator with XRE-family HTH domain